MPTPILAERLGHPHAIILYGAGNVGREVQRLLAGHGIAVACFLDRSVDTETSVCGIPVYRPDSCPLSTAERADALVILTVFNRAADLCQIQKQLRDAGFLRSRTFVQFHSLVPNELGDRYWLSAPDVLEKNAEDVDRTAELWADQPSIQLYCALISLRQTGEYVEAVAQPSLSTQYVPNDVPAWLRRRPVRLVDCGAYDGDTLAALLARGIDIERSAHFEADPNNFTKLAASVRRLLRDGDCSAELWPCAVTDWTGALRFATGLDEASAVVEHGDEFVPGITLDDALIGWEPNLIKMDIEGAEAAALAGARRTIGESRPDLAVCVYHRPEDLWRLPLLLASWPEMHGYRYYLRSHGFNGFDTVLYAVPG